MSKVLSFFSPNSGTELSSPDIPRAGGNGPIPIIPPQPSLPTPFSPAKPDLLQSMLSGTTQTNPFPVLYRRTPQAGIPPLNDARFQVPEPSYSLHSPASPPQQPLPLPNPSAGAGSLTVAKEPPSMGHERAAVDDEQALIQSSSEIGSFRDASSITSSLRPIDGGLSMMLEHTAESLGYESPLKSIPLDGITQDLLKNVGNLVHFQRKLYPEERGSRIEGDVTQLNGHPSLADLPVTHNVFDEDVSEEMQVAMNNISDGSFKLPEVQGVPFHEGSAFN